MNATNLKAAKIAASLVLGLCTYGVLSSAHAAEARLEPIHVQSALAVECAAPRVPGRLEFARAFDIAIFAQTEAIRVRARHAVKRACDSGAQRVLLVKDEAAARQHRQDYVAAVN
jgi:hypothetical protein